MFDELYARLPNSVEELGPEHFITYGILNNYSFISRADYRQQLLFQEAAANVLGEIMLAEFDVNDTHKVRAASELVQEFRQRIEQLLIIPPQAEHYGLYHEQYLASSLMLPLEYRTTGNIALLIGCLTPMSALTFIDVVHEVSPQLVPVIIDLEGYLVPKVVSNVSRAVFIYADGSKLPFPDKSIAMIHTNFLFGNSPEEIPVDRTAIMREVRRSLKPSGVLAMAETNQL